MIEEADKMCIRDSHKMSIALFSAILFVMNWEFMKSWFGDYAGLLAGGYAVTLVITIGLFLFCCSKKFHRLIFRPVSYTHLFYGNTDLVKLAFILCSQILQIFLGVFDGTVV